jgi:putative transposase
MKLTVQLKLNPTPEQADALKRTLETVNAACDYISQLAWELKTFRQFAIHKLTYATVRERFDLAAQLTVRCIAKVADAYKVDRKVQRSFAPHGALAYDNRILSFALPAGDPIRHRLAPTPVARTAAWRNRSGVLRRYLVSVCHL